MTEKIFEIQIKNHLYDHWEEWFQAEKIEYLEEGVTALVIRVPDQPALHGFLERIRVLNLTLNLLTNWIHFFRKKQKSMKYGPWNNQIFGTDGISLQSINSYGNSSCGYARFGELIKSEIDAINTTKKVISFMESNPRKIL